jgi:hypothetical protein
LLLLFTAAALCTAVPATANGAGGDKVTVAIACPDGVVDQDWRMIIDLTDANGKAIGQVTHYVPYHTTANSAAAGAKDGMNNKYSAGATTSEGSNPTYPANQSEDINLPPGFCIGKVVTEKKSSSGTWSGDKGHLKVFRGSTQISVGKALPLKALLLARRNGELTKAELEATELMRPIRTLALGLESFDVDPVVVELALSGLSAEGHEVMHEFRGSFQRGTPVDEVLFAVGDFAAELGFTVEHSRTGEIVLKPSPAGPEYYAWSYVIAPAPAECAPEDATAQLTAPAVLPLPGKDWTGVAFSARESLREYD